MNVLPFDPDPRFVAFFRRILFGAAAAALGLALRKAIGRFLDEDDPHRELIAQALLYGGTCAVIALAKFLARTLQAEEPTGRPLVAVEERAFGNWTIARLCSLRQRGCEKRGKRARREIQVFATFGIVHVEYGDGAQVYISAELFGRRQQAVHEKAPHGPRYEFILGEPDSMPLIVGGHPAFYTHLSGSRYIRDYPDLRFARSKRCSGTAS
jgi:hypothetical protein